MNSTASVLLAPSSQARAQRVLVVDDDSVVRNLHRWILERGGFEVTTAGDGESALRALERADVDLVLLDVLMSGMSGLMVLEQLQHRSASVPVILVTGLSEIPELVAGLDSGADDYITKPCDPRELLARVSAVLRRRRLATPGAVERHVEALDGTIREVIRNVRFDPVFQPIVDLRTRSTVGFEALTRFHDGARPDMRFIDAHLMGLGDDLEVATLSAAIDSAKHLPAATSLHLNVSPRLLANSGLRDLLDRADRPVVVEITEHARIDDYERINALLQELGDGLRVAIDDAGAGYSSMTHILAISPHEVKLDKEWVRGVDVNVARQALVSGFVSFACTTGTTLVAEGIETEGEAAMLERLGVGHGQGYHLGRPKPSHEW
jgi:EAL domain-containing protein (putative c-di-GMP-specific phosphodiesterase class I)/ActR/RegA family two-component response regulator